MYTALTLAGIEKLHGEELGNLREQVPEIERREHEAS
jgi:hypothetical protein